MARKPRPEEFTTARDVMNALQNAALIMSREETPEINEKLISSHYLPAALALTKALSEFVEQEQRLSLAEAALICQAAALRLTQVRLKLDE